MEERSLRLELFRVTRSAKEFTHRAVEPLCRRHGITLQQLYIITELKVEPDQTVTQLSDCVGILRPNFPLVCRKLENNGLIQRRRNEIDHRSFILRLTEEGEAVLDAIDEDIRSTYQDQLEGESEETYRAIIQGFAALNTWMRKFNP